MKHHCCDRRPSETGLALLALTTAIALLSMLSPPAVAQAPDGLWQSDGYGLLMEINGAAMRMFQTTSISCLPWWTARRLERRDGDGELVFDRGDAHVRLTADPSSDALLMREGPSISSVTLRRVNVRPQRCMEALPNTPLENYAVFWQTFAEQFALFPAYRIDWTAVDRRFRPRVTSSTTPDELFAILREMILPFHNAHTNINAASIHRQYIGYRTASEIGRRLEATSSLSTDEILAMFDELGSRTRAIVESSYAAEGRLRPYVNEKIWFGALRNSIGYLRILAFDDYTKGGGFEQGAAALEAALDEIFKEAERMKGLIVDVRVNTGGADPLCLAIASRLTDVKYLAYSKVTRSSGSGPLRFTAPQPAWVQPSMRAGYRGPVALLIGPDTLSGGETFAMALMKRTPRVTSIGENTQGVFSDVWGRKLPNGWTFGLPTERYLTGAGESFDGRGVSPDLRVAVYPHSDLEQRRDGAVERAIRTLGGR